MILDINTKLPMTWSSSHLGISTLALYIFSTKQFKQELKENPRLFLILSIGAIAPDFDLILSSLILELPEIWFFQGIKEFFSGSHRTWSHTFFLPLFLILLSAQLARIRPNHSNLGRNIRIFGLMWISHIIFDLTFGPLALFYPLDDRFYDVIFGLNVGLEGNIFVPVTYEGIFTDVTFKGKEVGTATFFVNWTAEQRISTFGGPSLRLVIRNFWLHVTLLVYYLIEVIYPWLKFEILKIKTYSKLNTDKQKMKRVLGYLLTVILFFEVIVRKANSNVLRIKRSQTSWYIQFSLIILILASYLGGPHYGQSWSDEKNEGETYHILSDGIKLFSAKVVDPPEESFILVTVTVGAGAIDIDMFSFLSTVDIVNDFSSAYQILLDVFDDGNITFGEFIMEYQLLVNNYVPINSVNNVNTNNSARWEYQSTETIIILTGFYSWDPSNYFIKGISYGIHWTTPRIDEYRIGILLISLFSFLLIVSMFNKYQKITL